MPKTKETALERSIRLRTKHLERLENRKKVIRAEAEEDCRAIDKIIAERRVLLDALKRGAIKA